MNALIPLVLRRGTTRYPDMETISARLDELYGTAIEPVVRRIGEIQCLGFYASIPEEEYLPGNNGVLEQATAPPASYCSPRDARRSPPPKYVDSEREKAEDIIRSRVNDKRSYSVTRCIEEMSLLRGFRRRPLRRPLTICAP